MNPKIKANHTKNTCVYLGEIFGGTLWNDVFELLYLKWLISILSFQTHPLFLDPNELLLCVRWKWAAGTGPTRAAPHLLFAEQTEVNCCFSSQTLLLAKASLLLLESTSLLWRFLFAPFSRLTYEEVPGPAQCQSDRKEGLDPDLGRRRSDRQYRVPIFVV